MARILLKKMPIPLKHPDNGSGLPGCPSLCPERPDPFVVQVHDEP